MLQDGLSHQSEKYFSVTVGQGYWSEVWRFIRRSRFMHKTNYSLLPRGWDFRRFPGSRNDWKEPHLEVRTSFPNGVRNAVRTGRGRVSSRSYNCAKFSKRRRTSRCNEMRRWRFAEMLVRFVLKFSLSSLMWTSNCKACEVMKLAARCGKGSMGAMPNREVKFCADRAFSFHHGINNIIFINNFCN